MDDQSIITLLLLLDIKSLMGVLIWGDFALAVLSFGYYKFHVSNLEEKLINQFGFAKLLQGFAWFLLFLRGTIPDIISVLVANSILNISFYLESIIMLRMTDKLHKKWTSLQTLILVTSLCIFYGFQFRFAASNIRVAISSFSILFLLLCPTMIYVFNKKSSQFKKYVGSFILVFLIVLLTRAIQALIVTDTNIFTSSIFQSATFITLILLLFINGAGFLLLMYERADQQLKLISELDPLTHIYNRRYFMSKADLYISRHQKDKKELSLLFIDIDHFKQINDTYGHLFGDEVLKRLADILNECVRPVDLCCRYGGEEFAILLYETNLNQGMIVGNRIRQSVENLEFDNKSFRCTVSVGVYSGTPDETITLERFIDNSDIAMYNAKQSGRNRVIAFESLVNGETTSI